MDSTLILATSTKAYADTAITNQPRLNGADWTSVIQVPVSNPQTAPYTIAPATTQAIFSGIRSTAIDNTTQFTLSLSPLSEDRYRFTNSAGTAPAFRTVRALTLSSHAVTIAVNANQTVTMSATAGLFSAVQAGDVLFIPGTTTGDAAGPFNVLNEGSWTVLSVAGDGSSVQIARPTGATFTAIGETQTPSTDSQIIAFSAAGVQVGDAVKISAGFTGAVLQTYTVVSVTPTWFEVVSTVALPVSAVAAPGTAGIVFYTSAKRYARIMADQPIVLLLNGDTSDTNEISPWVVGDKANMGEFSKTGSVYSLSIQNLSSSPANVVIITAE